MYVLEATKETQGDRDDDYVWTIEGELVFIPPLGCRTPSCGCHRGFAGMTSHRATTTARIAERTDMDVDAYWDVIYQSMTDQGYDIIGSEDLIDAVDEQVRTVQLFGISGGHGTVVGRTASAVFLRRSGSRHGRSAK
jgi:hypothetical protein